MSCIFFKVWLADSRSLAEKKAASLRWSRRRYYEVSAVDKGYSGPRRQTLMVDVMEYLRLETVVSIYLQRSDMGKLTQQELRCCVQWSRRRERLIESNPRARCPLSLINISKASVDGG